MLSARTVGAYEAKTTLPALLNAVASGQEVIITKHDRPVARLVPIAPTPSNPELFARVRELRSRVRLRKGETARDLIVAGRRI